MAKQQFEAGEVVSAGNDSPTEPTYVGHRPAARSMSTPTVSIAAKPLIAGVLVLIVATAGFVGGMQYQKGKSTTTTASNASFAGQGGTGQGGFGGRAMNGGFGTVTAVSDSSISVSERRTSGTKTYSISSSTTITDNGTTVTTSDIQTGDSVLIRTSSSTSTAATTIEVNPSFQGGPGGAASGSSSSSSTDPTSTDTTSGQSAI